MDQKLKKHIETVKLIEQGLDDHEIYFRLRSLNVTRAFINRHRELQARGWTVKEILARRKVKDRPPKKASKAIRVRVRGRFVRYHEQPRQNGPAEKVVVLADVRKVETGELLCEQLWFRLTQRFSALGRLEPGDVVEFEVRVNEERAAGWDSPDGSRYKLTYPTKIMKVESAA